MDFSSLFQQWTTFPNNLYQRLLQQTFTILSAPTSIPPDRLLIEICTMTANTASDVVTAAVEALNVSQPATPSSPRSSSPRPLSPNSSTIVVDVLILFRSQILSYNNEEQMTLHFENHCEQDSLMTIGKNNGLAQGPAPQSIWALARTSKKLFKSFLPDYCLSESADEDLNAQLVMELLLPGAIVNIRRIEDLRTSAEILDALGLLMYLPEMRLWVDDSQNAAVFFMMDPEDMNVCEFMEEFGELWYYLETLHIVPLEFPRWDDVRYDRLNDTTYRVSQKEWAKEAVREAENLPCLAERKCGSTIWKSYVWTATEHHPEYQTSDEEDEWGLVASDYEFREDEDEYW